MRGSGRHLGHGQKSTEKPCAPPACSAASTRHCSWVSSAGPQPPKPACGSARTEKLISLKSRNRPVRFRIRGLSLGASAKWPSPRSPRAQIGLHVFLCIADHYEPMWNGAAAAQQSRPRRPMGHRISSHHRRIPRFARPPPQHTFFYPAEEYNPGITGQAGRPCVARVTGTWKSICTMTTTRRRSFATPW